MTTAQDGGELDEVLEARIEALQAVVDRVTSWQESAPEGTVRDELDKGLAEVGLDLDGQIRERIVDQIHEDERVDVRSLLT